VWGWVAQVAHHADYQDTVQPKDPSTRVHSKPLLIMKKSSPSRQAGVSYLVLAGLQLRHFQKDARKEGIPLATLQSDPPKLRRSSSTQPRSQDCESTLD